MLGSTILGDETALEVAGQTMMVILYMAIIWFPLRCLVELVRYRARRRHARELLMELQEKHEDSYRIGMKILPPM